jgi:hypothetical protein
MLDLNFFRRQLQTISCVVAHYVERLQRHLRFTDHVPDEDELHSLSRRVY